MEVSIGTSYQMYECKNCERQIVKMSRMLNVLYVKLRNTLLGFCKPETKLKKCGELDFGLSLSPLPCITVECGVERHGNKIS